MADLLKSTLSPILAPITGDKDPFHNLSWVGAPLSLFLAALPHWYTIYLAESSKIQGGWSNVNPRFWVQSLIAKSASGKKLSKLELKILRGQSCQANAFENVPTFLATLVFANVAGLPVDVINRFVVGYLASRVVYTLLYLHTESKTNSYARTVVFNFAILWMVGIWVRAGLKISPKL